MRVHILGSAAGGGFPQWNCNCRNCYGVRNGKINASARTQSSIAVSLDGERWLLINASPDIRAQLEANPALQPKRGLRDTGIGAVVLVDSQIDHASGLLMLREGCPFDVYASSMVHQDLSSGFPVFPMLESWNGGINYCELAIDGSAISPRGFEGLTITAVPIHGKAPPYSPHRHDPHVGDNVALYIQDVKTGRSVFYAPGLSGLDEPVLEYMIRSDCLMVDGTFWREDEMIYAGVGTKLAKEMGHLPQSGRGGMIELLRCFPEHRKILIHINNTNPILDNNSAERRVLDKEGIEVAYDGMEIDLSRGEGMQPSANALSTSSGLEFNVHRVSR
ncbi:Coenzyme PQQ synthesis protein B [Zhongshania aliphaticivorans]|uniref:Coenzyme PQQ synthesis protein B n=1 Tax=Zhongshania aliphaticivorans TaxID=1470434 RepID=A0A5S9NB73_9GAMM|nr:pyrroloquinoline quinone biosynthesis protein PqqB [Zhongshania aliphaticivorans]CAA0080681.1 Coenzyme PQQ synthesis protein B [Zhongshania aliphaticivorans]CAA0085457.1 Coenzyme PQQ synthesis protein B [Zhongshania aliphaticivorans]